MCQSFDTFSCFPSFFGLYWLQLPNLLPCSERKDVKTSKILNTYQNKEWLKNPRIQRVQLWNRTERRLLMTQYHSLLISRMPWKLKFQLIEGWTYGILEQSRFKIRIDMFTKNGTRFQLDLRLLIIKRDSFFAKIHEKKGLKTVYSVGIWFQKRKTNVEE